MHTYDYINDQKPILAEYTKKGSLVESMPKAHVHNSYELYYLLEGERYYFIQNKTYHVSKGMLVLIAPNVIHRTLSVGDGDHERLLLNIEPSYLASYVAGFSPQAWFLGFNPEQPVIQLSLSQQSLFREKMHAIYLLLQDGDGADMNRVMVYLLELLIRLSDIQLETESRPVQNKLKGNNVFEKISEVVQYINHHYQDELTLTALAELFHYSPSYLSRNFKEGTGFNVKEYINQVRLLEAEKLLTATSFKIIQVSQKTGFASQTHFGRQFRKCKGMSPTAYRKYSAHH